MSKLKKRAVAAALSALMGASMGIAALAGCGGGEQEEVMQSTVQDSAPRQTTALDEVKITDDYAVNALKLEYEYLISLDQDKLLHWFYRNADLESPVNAGYGGGWESSLIGGHTLGHYLSALSQAAANAGLSESQRTTLNGLIGGIVRELKTCQDNAGAAGAKAGFLWGAKRIGSSKPEIQFDNVEKGLANIVTQAWVPWYTMHKILAGLYDAYVLAGNETAKDVLLALSDWVCERVGKWSAQTQKTVLKIEYGGMNDILYHVYALTGEDKYAVAAHKFDEETLFEKVLDESPDYLNNLHANTTIPKILGALSRYVYCNGKTVDGEVVDASEELSVAESFFDYVLAHHSYVTGGNSEWEHFGRDDVLNKERTNCNCETCNTYNMLKLARTLFTITGDKKYLDYYENTYYNAIWSSQNPETGMTTYFQPMASGYFKVYSSPENSFWCCTGSGMESMTKLNDSIYYRAGNAVYVSLYLSSEYRAEGVSFTQTADLEHSDTVRFTVTEGETVLRLRVPDWTLKFEVRLNGAAVKTNGDETFVSVAVKKGDELSVTLQKHFVAYNLPDGEDTYAFKWGPYVLSARLGKEGDMSTGTEGVSVTVPKTPSGDREYSVPATSVADFMKEIDDHMTVNGDGTFTLACGNGTLTYSLHFRQYTERYAIYTNFVVGEAQETLNAWTWETTDTRQPGYGQYETDLSDGDGANSAGSTSDAAAGGTSRYALAGKSFTYTAVKVQKDAQNRLLVSFAAADNGKTIKISSGNTVLYSATLDYKGADQTYAVEIPVPDALLKDSTIPLTFGATDGKVSARICGFVYSQARTFHSAAQSDQIAYFVDCGDYDPYTLSIGDRLGKFQSVTEQVYGKDPVTGKSWGILDPHAANIAGTPVYGIGTNSTWAYEFNTPDGSEKTATNRYTKNQFENGVARNLHYRFELDNGTYTVKIYFVNPWGNAGSPNVSANGTTALSSCATDRELSFSVTVSDGTLTLDITSPSLCINLAYILIEFA